MKRTRHNGRVTTTERRTFEGIEEGFAELLAWSSALVTLLEMTIDDDGIGPDQRPHIEHAIATYRTNTQTERYGMLHARPAPRDTVE